MAAPTITFRQFDVSHNSDPSGSRHLKTGDLLYIQHLQRA